MGRLTLLAPDITCAKCRENIETDLSEVAGVRSVTVVVESRHVTIEYDDAAITPETLRQAMADIGYPASG